LNRFISTAWTEHDSTIYFSTNIAIYSRKWRSNDIVTLNYFNKKITANDIEVYEDLVICGTKKYGLLFFKDNQFVFQVNQELGLHSEIIKKLKILDHYLIILTKFDLQILDLEKGSFLNISPADGIYPKSIIDFDVSNDRLWLLEKNGFYDVDLTTIENQNRVDKLYIESIKLNGIAQDYLNKSDFSYKQNNLSITYDYRDPLTRSGTNIYYQLEGFDLNWRKAQLTDDVIFYPYLPAGDFTLKLKAMYGDNPTETFIYSFNIDKPYWNKWWFYILMISLFFGLVWLIYGLRLNYQTRKIMIKSELDNSKLVAIRSQMNPHFIFNALNSIQHLVIKGDTDNSYRYINKFASLVRKTLDFSELERISIEEEISLIEVYLSLEHLRFDSFNYEIILPENTSIQIPTMLLQPFIENAIVHGLLHKKGPKKLTIRFELRDHLICIIEDNGIGRKKSREIKMLQTGSHKSFSMNAIKKRFEILNNYYHTDLGYEFEDFEPQGDLDVVSRVTLKIPINVGHQKK
jgi:hypothetical protein